MITLTLKWMGRLKEIEFPCTDTELQAKLADLRPPDASPAEIFVSSVEEPTALCMLETQFVNLDEINFLAKRMESFDYDELLQFYAAAQYEGFLYPKDLTVRRALEDLRREGFLETTQRYRPNGAKSSLLFKLHKK